jgi:mycothiol synthase
MSWPEGIDIRPISTGDVEAWAELIAAKEKVDRTGENYSAEDLAEELTDSTVDLERDTIALWADGRMIGFGKADSSDTVIDVDRVRIEGTIHPEWRRRGLGTTLTRWLIHRAGERHAERHPDASGEVRAGAISTNVWADRMLKSFGFTESRYYFDMRLPLGGPVPEAVVPDGFRLVAFDPQYEEALRLTHNEVFLDHWGSTPSSEEEWQVWFTGSRTFRPGVSCLVLDGETIAAYVLGYEWEADTAATGVREVYLGQVGTRREYRGRGLARAALAKVLAEAAQAGYERAGLGVDADNPTGALGLYESLGFAVHAKSVSYRLPLDV